MLASACSLVAACAVVRGLFPSASTPIHTTTSADTINTIGLRLSSKRPGVAGNAARRTAVAAAAGADGDEGDRQAFLAGHRSVPIPRLLDHRESPTRVKSSIRGGGEEAAATVQDVNARARNTSIGGTQPGDSRGERGGQSLSLPSRPPVNGQPYRSSPTEASPAATAMTTTRRATVVDEGDDPLGESEVEESGSSASVAYNSEATSDVGEGEDICSPLEVVGLSHCPEMILDGDGGGAGINAIIEKMLDAKTEMLRQVHSTTQMMAYMKVLENVSV